MEPVKLVETSGGGFLVRLLLGLDCGGRLVDPDLGRQLRGFGAAAEPLGVGGVGGGKDLRAAGLDLDRAAIVHGDRGVVADAAMAVFVVVVAEETAQKLRASWTEPKRPGNAGQYFRVLNWASP